MQLDTRAAPLAFVRPAADGTANASAIANPASKTTIPSGDGVIYMGHDGTTFTGGMSGNGLILVPIGTGADDNTMLMTVFAWDFVPSKASTTGTPGTWVAYPLAAYTCTLNANTGVAGASVGSSYLFCDTITLTTNIGNANISEEIAVSGTADFNSHIVVDTKGAAIIEVLFDRNGSATACNALYRRV